MRRAPTSAWNSGHVNYGAELRAPSSVVLSEALQRPKIEISLFHGRRQRCSISSRKRVGEMAPKSRKHPLRKTIKEACDMQNTTVR